MKKILSRLNGVKLGIEPVVKHSRPEKSIKVIRRNLTTLDTIGLAVLTVFPLVWLASMPTLPENLPTKPNTHDNNTSGIPTP